MRVVYSSTCPAYHDTLAISKAKWAQIESGDARSHRNQKSVLYSSPNPDTHDTKNIVVGKILQSHCDEASTQEVDNFLAIANFNGTEVVLSWDAVSGSYPATAGYSVYRNDILLANVAFGTNSYTDTAVVSGETYTYSVLFHPG